MLVIRMPYVTLRLQELLESLESKPWEHSFASLKKGQSLNNLRTNG